MALPTFAIGRQSPILRNDTSPGTRLVIDLAPEPPLNPTPLAHGKGVEVELMTNRGLYIDTVVGIVEPPRLY
jgi:hypothetical protein